MDFNDVTSIRLMKNLFDECRTDKCDSSDSENDGDFPGCSTSFGPGNIKPKKSEVTQTLENPLLKKIDPEASIQSIDEWNEQQAKDEELLDSRKQPDYTITYKQAVTTEDIYLQMGFKTPATSSCEDMIVDIQLPEETVKIDRMDLTVESDSVRLLTPVYRLQLALPHKIHPKKGRAEFDPDKKILKLTLRMNREYNFVNF